MGAPFKMKGSPMYRNFGIGSPLREEYLSKHSLGSRVIHNAISSDEYSARKAHDRKLTKQRIESGDFSKDKKGQYRNKKGQTPADVFGRYGEDFKTKPKKGADKA